jgi:hypothetical protein
MRRILGAVAVACLAAAVPAGAVAQPRAAATAADPAKLTEAHAIIAIMFPPAQRLQMIQKMQDDMMAQMRPLLPASVMADPGLAAIMDEYIADAKVRQRGVMEKHIPLMFEAMASAYTREFSLAELKDIHAFAATPSGAHYLSRSTAIVGDPAVAKVNTAMFQDINAVTQAALPALKTKVTTYLKAHPDLAAKIEAEDRNTPGSE